MAKTIVLGPAPHDLEDHLYDEVVAANCNAATLATAFRSRSIDVWNRKIEPEAGRPVPPQALAESDPTKAEPLDLLQPAYGLP